MAQEQLIIAISREYGSGGHNVAEKLSEIYGLPLYDNNILTEIAQQKNLDPERMKKYDESYKNVFLSRTVKGYSNSLEEVVAEMQFEYLREKADSGESFIIVGRCAETVLKDYDALVTFFILGDMEDKIKRTAYKENLSLEAAEKTVKKNNRKRKIYHSNHSDLRWGDSRNYDLCINSSRLGIDGTAQLICDYIEKWQNQKSDD